MFFDQFPYVPQLRTGKTYEAQMIAPHMRLTLGKGHLLRSVGDHLILAALKQELTRGKDDFEVRVIEAALALVNILKGESAETYLLDKAYPFRGNNQGRFPESKAGQASLLFFKFIRYGRHSSFSFSW